MAKFLTKLFAEQLRKNASYVLNETLSVTQIYQTAAAAAAAFSCRSITHTAFLTKFYRAVSPHTKS